jgi:hypothetical protein
MAMILCTFDLIYIVCGLKKRNKDIAGQDKQTAMPSESIF